MSRLRIALITAAAAGLVVLAAAAVVLVPLWTGPFLPSGASRLHIDVRGPSLPSGCPIALLGPARIETAGEDLVLVSVESGERVPVTWPTGYAAWRIDGRAVLAGPYGNVIGRDGDVLDALGGGLSTGDVFQVCESGQGLSGVAGLAPWILVTVSIGVPAAIVAVPRFLLRRDRPSPSSKA